MTDELDVILWDAFEEELQKSATHGNPLWDVLIEDGPQEPAYPTRNHGLWTNSCSRND